MDAGHDVRHLAVGFAQGVLDHILRLRVRDKVGRADREAGEQVEFCDNVLDVVDELTRAIGPEVVIDHVENALGRRAEGALLELAFYKLAVLERDAPIEVHQRKHRGNDFLTAQRLVGALVG